MVMSATGMVITDTRIKNGIATAAHGIIVSDTITGPTITDPITTDDTTVGLAFTFASGTNQSALLSHKPITKTALWPFDCNTMSGLYANTTGLA